jgi:hypothetical protein
MLSFHAEDPEVWFVVCAWSDKCVSFLLTRFSISHRSQLIGLEVSVSLVGL